MRDVSFSLGTLALAIVLTVVANLHPPQPGTPARAATGTQESGGRTCADGDAACMHEAPRRTVANLS